METERHIAYLYSRYPVISQTFCDSEMLALESMGLRLTVASINPPNTLVRHERLENLKAPILYPPPAMILEDTQRAAEMNGTWPAALVARHEEAYGPEFKASIRARNAVWFAQQLQGASVEHVHVHFANRATHTALFIKEIAKIPFSFTAHAQDFMVDLGSHDLLREMAEEAAFVVAVSDFSKNLLQELCPQSAEKIHRVYNGIDPNVFPTASPEPDAPFRILSIGRLIEFKGFPYLINACALLKKRGIAVECTIVGDGPIREELEAKVSEAGLDDIVTFAGILTQEQIKEEMTRSHVFALASIVDSKGASDILPTVIMEAMAAQLPVVSTRLVGIPEMVDSGETGILVPPKDSEALADALAKIAQSPELQKRMGEAGRAKCEALFSLEVTAATLKSHFEAPRKTSATAEKETMVYLAESTDGLDPKLLSELNDAHTHPAIRVLFCQAKEGGPFTSGHFLPDGMVLEAEWENHPFEKQIVAALRGKVSASISGETFFQAARRALFLKVELQKRQIHHLHSARSDTLLTAWLLKQLAPTLVVSATIEPRPLSGTHQTVKWVKDLDASSIADPKVAEKISDSADYLALAEPAEASHVKIGPIKFRKAKQEEEIDRSNVHASWFSRLQDLREERK